MYQARHLAVRRGLFHPLTLLLLAFTCNTLLWALIIPAGHAPDEWAHFDYILHLTTHRTLPIYGQTRSSIDAANFSKEAMQPPLYYLLAAPLQIALDKTGDWQIIGLRIYSILLGAITVAISYMFGRRLAPRQPTFALGIASLVAFNPMFTFMCASITNDNLINLIFAGLALLFLIGLQQPSVSRAWLLGLGSMLGIGLLTKSSILIGVISSGLLLCMLAWNQRGRRLRSLLTYGSWVGGTAMVIGGWWLARNWWLYGDPTAIFIVRTRTDVYPAWSYNQIGSMWEMLTTPKQVSTPLWKGIFHGFWGVFDFYTLWMSRQWYIALDILLVGGALGATFWALRAWQQHDPITQQRLKLASINASMIFLLLWSIISRCYQIDYQPQGRYLLPVLLPLATLIVAGWEQLFSLIESRQRAASLLTVSILGMNLLALVSAVSPAYHDTYLTTRASQPNISIQFAAGAFEARANFDAQQTQIVRLEVLLNHPRGAEGPLIWRLRQEGASDDMLIAVESKPAKGLARYLISVPHKVVVNTTYTLIVQAPLTTEEKRIAVYLSRNQPPAEDLDLQVIYPSGFHWTTLHQLDYLLRSAPPGWPRGSGQRLLYLLVPMLMLALAAQALRPISTPGWQLPIAAAALALILLVLWAPPRVKPDPIPVHNLDATAGPLLTLNDAHASVADLILLSGSPQTLKQPPDDFKERITHVQPYQFTINNDTRRVLAMQPPSAITYTLMLPPNARLLTALALNPQVWRPDRGDGVEFIIQLTSPTGTHELLHRYIDPKNQPLDRYWNEIALDLSPYGDQKIQLTLITLPGPAGDSSFDWAGWATPAILQK
jgi:4-amino-4-deoxy-L-arabinose transferase-like glycosyltransferase